MSLRTRLLPPFDRPRLPRRLTRDGWWLVDAPGAGAIDAAAGVLRAVPTPIASPPSSRDAAGLSSPETAP